MNIDTQMVFFPELSSLESEKLRFLRSTKADLKELDDDYEAIKKCHKILQSLISNTLFKWDENKNVKDLSFLCQYFIDNKLTNIKLNMQAILTNLYHDIDSAIFSEEFVELEAYRIKLTSHLQSQIKAIPSEGNDIMDLAFVQFLQLSSHDISGRIYHFYRYHYPHYSN